MEETLEILKQFAANGDNVWLQDKLEILENQIKEQIMITRTEDRHAKRVEAVDNSKRKVVLNPSKAWRRRRTT